LNANAARTWEQKRVGRKNGQEVGWALGVPFWQTKKGRGSAEERGGEERGGSRTKSERGAQEKVTHDAIAKTT